MKPKEFIKQLRLVLRIIAVGIWANIAFNYASKCQKEMAHPPTKEVHLMQRQMRWILTKIGSAGHWRLQRAALPDGTGVQHYAGGTAREPVSNHHPPCTDPTLVSFELGHGGAHRATATVVSTPAAHTPHPNPGKYATKAPRRRPWSGVNADVSLSSRLFSRPQRCRSLWALKPQDDRCDWGVEIAAAA